MAVDRIGAGRLQRLLDVGLRRALMWPVLLAAIGYLVFAWFSGGAAVWAATVRAGVWALLGALVLSLVNYALRFRRWQGYMAAMGHELPTLAHLQIYVAGFALTVTPGKAGEALRCVMLKRHGVAYRDSIAALFSERLSDLSAVVILCLFGLAAYPSVRPAAMLGAGLAIGLLLLTGNGHLSAWLARRAAEQPSRRWSARAADVLGSARRCQRPALLLRGLGLAGVGWLAEGLAFALILRAMDMPIGWTDAVLVFSFSMLAGALSLIPGGLGSTESVMLGLLVLLGAEASSAAAATVLIRLCTLWFAVALGAGCWYRVNRGEKRDIDPVEVR